MSASSLPKKGKKHNQYVTNTIFDPHAGGFTINKGIAVPGQHVKIDPNTKLQQRLQSLMAWAGRKQKLHKIHEEIAAQLAAVQGAGDYLPGVRHPAQ